MSKKLNARDHKDFLVEIAAAGALAVALAAASNTVIDKVGDFDDRAFSR